MNNRIDSSYVPEDVRELFRIGYYEFKDEIRFKTAEFARTCGVTRQVINYTIGPKTYSLRWASYALYIFTLKEWLNRVALSDKARERLVGLWNGLYTEYEKHIWNVSEHESFLFSRKNHPL